MYVAIASVVFFAAGIVVGGLIWRNNAKKFSRLEAEAMAKGKSVEDWLKGFLK